MRYAACRATQCVLSAVIRHAGLEVGEGWQTFTVRLVLTGTRPGDAATDVGTRVCSLRRLASALASNPDEGFLLQTLDNPERCGISSTSVDTNTMLAWIPMVPKLVNKTRYTIQFASRRGLLV